METRALTAVSRRSATQRPTVARVVADCNGLASVRVRGDFDVLARLCNRARAGPGGSVHPIRAGRSLDLAPFRLASQSCSLPWKPLANPPRRRLTHLRRGPGAAAWVLFKESHPSIQVVQSGSHSLMRGTAAELINGRDKVAVNERGTTAQRLGA